MMIVATNDKVPAMHKFEKSKLKSRIKSALLCLTTTALIAGVSTIALAGTVAATVSVDANQPLGIIPSTSVGVNTAIWDWDLTDTQVNSLLTSAGIKVLRYPGGSASDAYNWQTNTGINIFGSGATNWAPDATFDSYMTNVALPTGAAPLVTVNYGSNAAGTAGGDPSFAAAWVQYANITNNYGVKYWEIGNEVYGNGYYQYTDWETDLHDYTEDSNARVGAASLSPTSYGQNIVLYSNAMKAVDSTIKIGAVLYATTDGTGDPGDWNSKVLTQCGQNIDFVILHWYPEYVNDNDAILMADPEQQIADMVATTKSEINQYCGSNAPNIQIWVTETNSDASPPGKQMMSTVQSLFMADNIQTWLENGVSNVDYWDLHNGISTDGDQSSSLFGDYLFGDEGMLSNGSSNGAISEPAAETPFATYYAFQMINDLGSAGDTMIASSSNQSLVVPHATYRTDGSLAIMLENEDLNNYYSTTVNVGNYRISAGETGTIYTYGQFTSAVTTSSFTASSSVSVTVPPYTMEVLDFPGQYPNVPSHTFGAGLQMISFPCDFSDEAVTGVISPNPPMAAWDAQDDTYEVEPVQPADAYRIGHGYWIRVPSSGASTAAHTTLLAGTSTSMPLYAGWNIVGDPYSSALPESDLSVQVGAAASESLAQAVTGGTISTTLYTFSSGATAYTAQDASVSLQPFVGYWIYANADCTLTYNAPS